MRRCGVPRDRRGGESRLMYQVSRAIYRELSRDVVGRPEPAPRARPARLRVDGRAARRRPPLLRPAGADALPARSAPTSPSRPRAASGWSCERYLAVRRAAPGRAPAHRRRRQRQPAAVPRDDPPRHAVPAHAAARERLLPLAPAPGRDRGRRPGRPAARRLTAPATPPGRRTPGPARRLAGTPRQGGARRPSPAVRERTPFGGVVRPSSESCSPSGRFCVRKVRKTAQRGPAGARSAVSPGAWTTRAPT